MADEDTAEETEQGAGANDEEDVELLLEALMVGFRRPRSNRARIRSPRTTYYGTLGLRAIPPLSIKVSSNIIA